jgi:hypothetical protein
MWQACPVRATYEAWNGQTYPWPPPEGWHQAPDGRWWAPDSSPDDLDTNETPSNGHATTDTLNSSAEAAPDDDGDSSSDADQPGTSRLGPLPDSSAGLWEPDERQPWWQRPTIALPATVGGILALVILAVTLFGPDRTDRTAAEDDSAAPAPTPSSQPADSSATADDQPGADPNRITTSPTGDATTESSAQPSTIDGSDTPDGVTPGEADIHSSTSSPQATSPQATSPAATSSSTAAADAPSTTVSPLSAADAERADEFREYLADNGLSGSLISDIDLVEFANTFCIFAISADSREQYEASRNEAIADSGSELTESELIVAVDGAVDIFCSEDAERLDINSN